MWYSYGKTKNKFNAKSTEYEGQVYHSKREAGRAAELDLLERGGEIRNIKRQVRISFDICGNANCLRLCSGNCPKHRMGKVHHLSNYYLDFTYWDKKEGVEVYEEVKGMETGEWKQKWKLLCILYENDPKKKLIVVR